MKNQTLVGEIEMDFFNMFDESDNDDLMNLIARLECLIQSNVENKQQKGSYFFNYPTRITRDDEDYEKRHGQIPELKLDELDSVRYVFGANTLHIGRALFDVLKFLEYRYIGDLDFSDLERKYQAGHYKGKEEMVKDKLVRDVMNGLPMEHLFDY